MAAKKRKVRRRLLKNGELVPENPNDAVSKLDILTKCPRKWLFVDMETGTVWHKQRENASWLNIGYVDVAAKTSMVILPSASGGIPHFVFNRD
jgi:hypothetical protein